MKERTASRENPRQRAPYRAAIWLVLSFSVWAIAVCSAKAANDATPFDSMTAKALELSNNGQLWKAADLQQKVSDDNPKSWLARVALAYLRYKQGYVRDAECEEKIASRLHPGNEALVKNIGLIALKIGDYKEAIAAFEQALKIEPDDRVAAVKLAEALTGANRKEEALALLSRLSSKHAQSFDWLYQIGEAYLSMDEPARAERVSSSLAELAADKEQTAKADIQLLMALLREHKVQKAALLRDKVFSKDSPKDPELYLLAASELVPVLQPEHAKTILDAALKNMNSSDNAHFFYRLGMLFEQKSDFVAYDATKYDAWLGSAAKAYEQAIDLAPKEAGFKLALAGIFMRSGKLDEMKAELTKVAAADSIDPLAPFLLSRLADSCTAAVCSSAPSQTSARTISLNLTLVHFKLNGITCGCQLDKILRGLQRSKGVAFAQIVHRKPFEGDVIADLSVTPVEKLFDHAINWAFPNLAELKKANINYSIEALSSRPVKEADGPLRLALQARYGEILHFEHQFGSIEPAPPAVLAADATPTTTRSTTATTMKSEPEQASALH